MKRTSNNLCAWAVGTLFIPLLCWTPGAWAVGSMTQITHQLAHDGQTVHELMRLEMDQALRQARRASTAGMHNSDVPTDVHARPMTAKNSPRLEAIYGVGDRLRAEVRSNGQVFHYRRGQSWPIGIVNKKHAFVLDTMSAGCLTLSRDNKQHTLCLPTNGVFDQ